MNNDNLIKEPPVEWRNKLRRARISCDKELVREVFPEWTPAYNTTIKRRIVSDGLIASAELDLRRSSVDATILSYRGDAHTYRLSFLIPLKPHDWWDIEGRVVAFLVGEIQREDARTRKKLPWRVDLAHTPPTKSAIDGTVLLIEREQLAMRNVMNAIAYISDGDCVGPGTLSDPQPASALSLVAYSTAWSTGALGVDNSVRLDEDFDLTAKATLDRLRLNGWDDDHVSLFTGLTDGDISLRVSVNKHIPTRMSLYVRFSDALHIYCATAIDIAPCSAMLYVSHTLGNHVPSKAIPRVINVFHGDQPRRELLSRRNIIQSRCAALHNKLKDQIELSSQLRIPISVSAERALQNAIDIVRTTSWGGTPND